MGPSGFPCQAGFVMAVGCLAVEALLAEGGEYARHEPVLRVVARRIADEPLVLAQLAVESSGSDQSKEGLVESSAMPAV